MIRIKITKRGPKMRLHGDADLLLVQLSDLHKYLRRNGLTLESILCTPYFDSKRKEDKR